MVEMEPFAKPTNDDLSTCIGCSKTYDMGERTPKFLPCSHCFCLSCIKVSDKNEYLRPSYVYHYKHFLFWILILVSGIDGCNKVNYVPTLQEESISKRQ